MALELKLNYNQSSNGKQLVFEDNSNWGEGVNILDVISATITITFGGLEGTINLMAEFAENDPEKLTWEVLTQDLDGNNINQIFEDGVYNILYTVNTAGSEYEVSGNILLYFNVKSFVYKTFMNLNDNWTADLCNTKPVNHATNLWAALSALEYTAYLGNISRINRNLEFLQKLCKTTELYQMERK